MVDLRPMKFRSRAGFTIATTKLRLPAVFTLCTFSFLAGFLCFTLLCQDVPDVRPRSRMLQSVREKINPLPNGESGESSFTTIPFQVLSWNPRALYFPGFATAEHCKHVIDLAKSNLTPSTLALRKGETENNTKGVRTSSGTFISASQDKYGVLGLIEEKIAKATMIPRINGEEFNILRYEVGQKYDCHYDAFRPQEYGPQKSQRVASFLLYLSDVEEGGETMFPFVNGLNLGKNYNFRGCIGLQVKPRQGDGLLFYSLLPNGTVDEFSLHGSCPVIKGEKWVATKWIRDQDQSQEQ